MRLRRSEQRLKRRRQRCRHHGVDNSMRCCSAKLLHVLLGRRPLRRHWRLVASGFPFIALTDIDQVVHVTEVDFCIESHLVQAVKEVGDAG